MEIKQTTNYKIFKRMRGNREIFLPNIKNIGLSMERKNLLSVNPIIVNKNMEVVEGQHRLYIAQQNNLPIFYFQTEADINDVIALNTASKNWTVIDFAKSYAERGYENYQFILDMHQKYELPIATIVAISKDMKYEENSFVSAKSFRSGELILGAKERALIVEKCEMLNQLKPFFKKWNNRTFISAMLTVFKAKDFKMERLIYKLESGAIIEEKANKTQYLHHLEDLYNHAISKTNRRRLF